ncbi:DUF4365 domain-containing protein [Paraliomyxa miuraensis]|uniref:DUF4365 domain-containing protein n=1 Tax=Paraliomyxa miuraensis TaxID=376150 RepID=UPI00225246DC|nr:DUF4365 domain-containing protein [Paraliomyxa miuraensis]MCX4240134.1 DUF4365 domain-containing protein [Paraliomyxa miuraensis]
MKQSSGRCNPANGDVMAKRSEGQRIGSSGQRLVELLIEKTGAWISRRQDEDFGIDLEAELADPLVRGEILKLQIKGTTEPEVTHQGVKVVLETKYLRMAEGFRVPLVFVVADITGHQAWYIWLQGWLVEQRRVGKTLASFKDHVTVYIPETDTLTAGLQGPLKDVARWGHENQMVLSLMDTMRTAVATRNEKVLLSLAELIGSVDAAYQDFPLEQLIDTIVDMSTQPRAMWELSMLGRFLAIVGRSHGGKISKENVMRMVVPGEGASRAGLNGLGALYDAHEEHIRAMNLSVAFEAAGHREVSYYCRLREKFPGVKAMDLAFGNYDYTVGNFTVVVDDKGSFVNKWANRGESAYLDFLVLDESPPDNALALPPAEQSSAS